MKKKENTPPTLHKIINRIKKTKKGSSNNIKSTTIGGDNNNNKRLEEELEGAPVLETILIITKDRTPPAIMTNGPGGQVHITGSTPMIDKYRIDQMNAEHNVTDMHLACDDGHVPVHRFLLMGLSPFLRNILQNEDPSELAVIHLCGSKVAHVVQLMTLIYCGKCVIHNERDKDHVYRVMKSLGISCMQMQYRRSNTADNLMIPKIRFFQAPTHEDVEMETTFVDSESLGKALVQVRSPDIVNRTARNKRRRTRKPPIVTANEERAMELAPSVFECCCCQTEFQTYEELVNHVRTDCAKYIETDYNYETRQCLICEKNFPEDYHIWGVLNHVVECQTKPKKSSEQLNKPKVIQSSSTTTSTGVGNVFINCNTETSESNSGAISPVSESTSSNSKISSNNQMQEKPANTPEGISLSSNEIEIVEISDTEQNSPEHPQNTFAGSRSKELIRKDDDDEGLPPLVNLPLSSNAGKPKLQRPIGRKRRRRRPLVYNPHRNKRSRAAAQAIKCSSIHQANANGENQVQQNLDTQEQANDKSSQDNSIAVIEIDDDDDNDRVMKEVDREDNDVSYCLIPSIDPHILRTQLGLSPSSPLTNLPADTIHTLLHQCPLCNNEFERLKDVTKCLRYHGYRYCYACLQILPCQGPDFAQHWLNTHNISVQVDLSNKEDLSAQTNSHQPVNNKVPCPFCSKEYEFGSALASHLGNYHCSTRFSDNEIDENSRMEDRPCSSSSVVKAATTTDSHQRKTQKVESNSSKEIVTIRPGPSSSGSVNSSRSNNTIFRPAISTFNATSNKKSNNKSPPSDDNGSLEDSDSDVMICDITDIKSLATTSAAGAAASVNRETKRPFVIGSNSNLSSQSVAPGIEATATSSANSRRKVSSSSKSTTEMPSVVYIESGDSIINDNEGIDRRSSIETPSSMSLSDVIEENVSSTGLSLSNSSVRSPVGSSINSRKLSVASSRSKFSVDSDSLSLPVPTAAGGSASSSGRSSPRRLSLPIKNTVVESSSSSSSVKSNLMNKSRGPVSKSSSLSSRGSNRSTSSRKSSQQRKTEDENIKRLKTILGSVRIPRNDVIRSPPIMNPFQYEDISPASSPSPLPYAEAATVTYDSSLPTGSATSSSLPPPHAQTSSQSGLEKRSNRGKPQRQIDSDYEYEQQRRRRDHTMFPKPAVLHQSLPGSRRHSVISVDSLENQNQTSSSSSSAAVLSATTSNKLQQPRIANINNENNKLPTTTVTKNSDSTGVIVSNPNPTGFSTTNVLKTKAYYKDRPIHIIKAGVAPESVIISGRSTPSMNSDTDSNSNFGSAASGGPKSIGSGSCHIQSPPPLPPLAPALGVSTSEVPVTTSIPVAVLTSANNLTMTECSSRSAAPVVAVQTEDTRDNISVTSSSASSVPSATSKSNLSFLYQEDLGGVLYNVYCKDGRIEETVRIPADEDSETYD